MHLDNDIGVSNDANSTTTTVSINLEKDLQSVTNQPTRIFLQQNLLLDRAQVEFRPGEGVWHHYSARSPQNAGKLAKHQIEVLRASLRPFSTTSLRPSPEDHNLRAAEHNHDAKTSLRTAPSYNRQWRPR